MDTIPETASVNRRALAGPPHACSVDVLLEDFTADPQRGLNEARIAALRERHGYNELAAPPAAPRWKKFLAQFRELVVLILIAAAIISGVLGEWPDALAILAIVLLNGILGFVQEAKAERALAALRSLSAPTAKAVRDGVLRSLPARELVPGDLIELEAGDNAPADARLIRSFGLQVQESALTGESAPVEKDAGVLPPSTPLADRRNMIYLGTLVTSGKANAVVVATGMQAELGRIAGMLQRVEPEPTPLQRRLAELGRLLIVVCLAIVGVIFLLQLLRGAALWEVFMLSVGLAVAAVPEGLPAVVTITLALGLQRMVRRNALVRKLPSVETLGSVTVICTDKTGTLTRNEMTVREVWSGDRRYLVTGAGYTPHGEFFRAASLSEDSAAADPSNPQTDPHLLLLLQIGARCNNARLVPDGDRGEPWQVIGDPTEGALLAAAGKAGLEVDRAGGEMVYEIPFDSRRKTMSVILRDREDAAVLYTKGAPEAIVSRCTKILHEGNTAPLDDAARRRIANANAQMASRALRVLAFAYRPIQRLQATADDETGLIFVGMVGMIDPPREEAAQAVLQCRAAGIRPVMITGDHPATALAIARELHIAKAGDEALSGVQLDATSDAELEAQVEQIPVYARVSPEHKLRIVRAWQRRGQVVAMTGDGVNDAPAIKAADIGIAMGRTGSDVTKEASDIVLTDDNFASIVNAVEEGRGIFDNIQKFVQYLLSCNASEVLLMFFAALVGWPSPLTAVQLLWINLVTDGLPALALAMEPPERDLMRRSPRPPHESVITLARARLILTHGLLIAVASVLGFWLVYQGDPQRLPQARTAVFCIVAFSQLFYSLGCRSQRYTMPEIGVFSNPYLFGAIAVSALLQLSFVTLTATMCETLPHPGMQWAMIVLLAAAPVTIIEIAKLVRRGIGGSAANDEASSAPRQ